MEGYFTNSPLIDAGRMFLAKRQEDGMLGGLNEVESCLPQYELSDLFYEDQQFRTINKKNMVIYFTGDTGIGKSTFAQSVEKKRLDFVLKDPLCFDLREAVKKKYGRYPEFTIKNIGFETHDFIEAMRDSVPLETFQLDEAESSKIIGTGSMREAWDKKKILKRVRAHQNNFNFCDPMGEESTLLGLCTFLIHVEGINYEAGLNRGIISIKYEGFFRRIGHIIAPYYTVPGYEQVKDKQIDEVKRLEGTAAIEKVWEREADMAIEKGIGDVLIQDWPILVEEWTGHKYAKGELRAIVQKVRFKLARPKNKNVKKPQEITGNLGSD